MKAVPFGAYVQSRRIRAEEMGRGPKISEPIGSNSAQNPEAVRAEARQQGFEEGYAAAAAEYDQRLVEMQVLMAERIEAARLQTLAGEASLYKRHAARELARMRKDIEAQIAPVLKAMFDRAIEDRALRETRATLAETLHLRKLGDIRVVGPDKYLACLRNGLGAMAETIEFTEADQPDVSISFGQTTIHTQIGKWKEKLDQLSGDGSHV